MGVKVTEAAAETSPGGCVVSRAGILDGASQRLIATLDEELTRMYPEEGACHFRLDPDEVAPGNGAFFVATVGGEAMGCGAVRRIETGGRAGEVKRMFVDPRARGRGIGRALLDAIEREARALGLDRLVLETGTRQLAALALYERAGFVVIPPFGEYVGSPLSVCMAKALTA